MKKLLFSFFFALILTGYGFSQNNLTPDQIRKHANELGVPFEALQKLVDSHRSQTGLTNPNASGAQLLSIKELNFMAASDMLKVDSYYRIRANYWDQYGRNVTFYVLPHPVSAGDQLVGVEASFLINIPQGTLVDALLGVRHGPSRWGNNKQLYLVEIALAE
jgi:hypothetical protein